MSTIFDIFRTAWGVAPNHGPARNRPTRSTAPRNAGAVAGTACSPGEPLARHHQPTRDRHACRSWRGEALRLDGHRRPATRGRHSEVIAERPADGGPSGQRGLQGRNSARINWLEPCRRATCLQRCCPMCRLSSTKLRCRWWYPPSKRQPSAGASRRSAFGST